MPLMIATAVMLVIPVLSAGQIPHLTPRVILPGEGDWNSFWLLAPNIAIVKVRSAQPFGPTVSITPNKLTVRLVAVDADVESVIRGTLAEDAIRFYFFTNVLVPNEGYTTRLSWFEPNKRYVVFLREDGAVLRTMADLTEPNILIRTGPPAVRAWTGAGSGTLDVGGVIATAALTPSANYDKAFGRAIEETYSRLLQITSPSIMGGLLRRLLKHDDREIRERACLTLSMHLPYRDFCLEGLKSSQDHTIRQQASMLLSNKESSSRSVLKALRDDPSSLSVSGRVDDLAGDLELFTFDSDEVIREEACETLRRLFPLRAFSTCAHIVRK